MIIEMDSSLVLKALNYLAEYAYETERDGDGWKAKEVAEFREETRKVWTAELKAKGGQSKIQALARIRLPNAKID